VGQVAGTTQASQAKDVNMAERIFANPFLSACVLVAVLVIGFVIIAVADQCIDHEYRLRSLECESYRLSLEATERKLDSKRHELMLRNIDRDIRLDDSGALLVDGQVVYDIPVAVKLGENRTAKRSESQ